MKISNPVILSVMAALSVFSSLRAQTPSSGPLLKLERSTNAFDLTVSSLSATGALFIYQASDVQSLKDSPSLLLGTNHLSTNDLRVPIAPSGNLSGHGFFSAIDWPDLTTDDFGDPSNYPPDPSPDKILFVTDLPTNFANGQTFTVDFLITDPTGQPVDISGTATILVVSESDSSVHPDATVTPSFGRMTNGFMRAVIAVNAISSVDGYTLALSIVPGTQASIRRLAPNVSALFLKSAFSLGPVTLTPNQRADYTQRLEERRLANADNGDVWDNPLPGVDYYVGGSFGEWRGDDDDRSHYGIDLDTTGSITAVNVKAARGGVVSCIRPVSSQSDMGHWVVIDHGNGFFSGYLHLKPTSIRVHLGQAVARGDILATSLFTRANWGPHLHFEIRTNLTSAWEQYKPGGDEGTARDPIQVAGLQFIPNAKALPKIELFALTRKCPGTTVFRQKAPPTEGASGLVYIFVKVADLEKPPGRHPNPGPRSVTFFPEGATATQTIAPSNAAAISSFLPFGSDVKEGFARYTLPPTNNDYFRYWFCWDTSAYATNPIGARSFQVGATNYSGGATNCSFKFGPQILALVPDSSSPRKYGFTNVSYLGTNSTTNLTQPDQYKVQIIQSKVVLPGVNEVVLPGVEWGSPLTKQPDGGGYTPIQTQHLKTNFYTFTLPANTSSDGLKLRISSLLAPDIAHEVCFCSASGNWVSIPPGTFVMGSPDSEKYGGSGAGETQHTVTLTKGFCMSKYLVTQGDYLSVMGSNPSYFHYYNGVLDTSLPVEQVSWYDATAYCEALTEREQLAGRLPAGWVYRLPTEAEWEYACRAGTTTAFYFGNTIRGGMANFYSYYEYDAVIGDIYKKVPVGYVGQTTRVGSYDANLWGLYDMCGNVFEWCQDWYGTYPAGPASAPAIDPVGPASGSLRVMRGGYWGSLGGYCRSAYRLSITPGLRGYFIGFRPVLAPGQP